MKVKLKELVQADKSLSALIEQKDVPAKFQWRLATLVEAIRNYQELHDKIVKDHYAVNDDGKLVVKKESVEQVQSEINELLEEEVEINYEAIDINEIMNKKDETGEPLVKINAIDFINLRPF